MRAFRDAAGRDWLVRVDVGTVEDVRAACGVDLYGLFADGMGPLAALLDDPAKTAAVVAVACREQIEAAGVDPRAFGRSLAGDALEDATDALLEAVIDFFPRPRRAALRGWKAAATRAAALAAAEAERELGAIDPRAILDSAAARSRPSSGDSPGRSGWTPPGSPSASSP